MDKCAVPVASPRMNERESAGDLNFARAPRCAAQTGLVWAKRFPPGFLVWALAFLLAGCFTAQVYPTLQLRSISLRPGDLEAHGIGFITPSAATGQEEEKQAVAFVFADVLREERRNVRVVPLAETLSAVNKAGLADAYSRMYHDYRDTGLLKFDILQKIGVAVGVRYIAQIKVQSFGQHSRDRLGLLGLRVVETKRGTVRLFMQIWDSMDGSVAWEATQELHYAFDTITEEQMTLKTVVGRAAQDLVAKLP